MSARRSISAAASRNTSRPVSFKVPSAAAGQASCSARSRSSARSPSAVNVSTDWRRSAPSAVRAISPSDSSSAKTRVNDCGRCRSAAATSPGVAAPCRRKCPQHPQLIRTADHDGRAALLLPRPLAGGRRRTAHGRPRPGGRAGLLRSADPTPPHTGPQPRLTNPAPPVHAVPPRSVSSRARPPPADPAARTPPEPPHAARPVPSRTPSRPPAYGRAAPAWTAPG